MLRYYFFELWLVFSKFENFISELIIYRKVITKMMILDYQSS